jgi:hypothetical protein
MPISTDCPQCQAHFILPDNFAGRQLKCQKCGRMFQAPLPPDPPDMRDAPRRTSAASSAGSPVLDAEVVDGDAPAPMAHAIQTSPRSVAAAGARGDDSLDRPRSRRDERDDPDDRGDRDRLRRGRRVYRERDDSSVALWVAGGIVGGVIFIVLLGVAAWMMLRPAPVALAPAPPPMPPAGAVIKQPAPPMMFPGRIQQPGVVGQPAVVGNDRAIRIELTKGAYQEVHRLEANDPVDPQRRQFCKVFLIKFEQGKNYVIDHIPARQNFFDAWLRLEKNPGQQLMQDDDGGDGLNSRIHFNCNETADYRIICTSLGGGLGNFTITVRDASVPEQAQTRPLANIPLPQPDVVPQQLQITDGLIGKLPAKTIQLGPIAGDVCLAPDGQSIYVLGGSGLLRQIATRDWTDIKRINLGNGCRSLALSAAGLAVAATVPGEVWVLDPATLSIKNRISAPGVQEIVSGPATTWGYALFPKNQPGNAAERHVGVLDLAKGANLLRLPLPRFADIAVADAETVLMVPEVFDAECLVRYKIQPDGSLARQQASPRLGRSQIGIGIVLSRDGKYACVPALGGNPPIVIGGNAFPQQALHVFETKNLLQPAFSMATGPFARGVGLDPEASFAYVATTDAPLSVFNFKGAKLAQHGTRQGEQAQQILVLAPRKVLLRYMQRVVIAELAEDGRQLGAAPLPKLETRTVDNIVQIEDTLTPEDSFDEQRRANYKDYLFRFEANQPYTIDHVAKGFDAYLFVLNENEVVLRADDDGGVGLNSRILFNPPSAGVYKIRASSLGHRHGDYVLTVRKGTAAPGSAGAPPSQPPPTVKSKAPTKTLVVTPSRNPATADEELSDATAPRLFATGLRAKATFTIEVKAQGFTPAVRLMSFTGKVLQEVRAKEPGELRMVHEAAASEPARIEVSTVDGKTGRFTISLGRQP